MKLILKSHLKQAKAMGKRPMDPASFDHSRSTVKEGKKKNPNLLANLRILFVNEVNWPYEKYIWIAHYKEDRSQCKLATLPCEMLTKIIMHMRELVIEEEEKKAMEERKMEERKMEKEMESRIATKIAARIASGK